MLLHKANVGFFIDRITLDEDDGEDEDQSGNRADYQDVSLPASMGFAQPDSLRSRRPPISLP